MGSGVALPCQYGQPTEARLTICDACRFGPCFSSHCGLWEAPPVLSLGVSRVY